MFRKLALPFLVCAFALGVGVATVRAKDGDTMRTQKTETKDTTQQSSDGQKSITMPDPFSEFVKQKEQEISDAKKKLDATKKSCSDQTKAFLLSRAQQRKDLVASCKPLKFTGEPLTKDEAKQRSDQQRAAMTACRQQIVTFDKETKTQLQSIRLSCWQLQRSVLGLSTEIPYSAAQ